MPTRNKPPDMTRQIEESDDMLAEAALDMFARLVEILATRGALDSAEIMELVEVAKEHIRG